MPSGVGQEAAESHLKGDLFRCKWPGDRLNAKDARLVDQGLLHRFRGGEPISRVPGQPHASRNPRARRFAPSHAAVCLRCRTSSAGTWATWVRRLGDTDGQYTVPVHGRNAALASREQPDCLERNGQRDTCPIKVRPCGHRDQLPISVPTVPTHLIPPARRPITVGTQETLRPTRPFQVIQTVSSLGNISRIVSAGDRINERGIGGRLDRDTRLRGPARVPDCWLNAGLLSNFGLSARGSRALETKWCPFEILMIGRMCN